jgi:hypothetical protein
METRVLMAPEVSSHLLACRTVVLMARSGCSVGSMTRVGSSPKRSACSAYVKPAVLRIASKSSTSDPIAVDEEL